MVGLNAAWRCLILAGLSLLMAGMPVPRSSRKTSLTLAWPSYGTTDEFSAQQLNAEPAAGHLSEPYRSAWFRLWGADGDDLVIRRQEDDPDMSWVRVIR
jgi:hypothetical protein